VPASKLLLFVLLCGSLHGVEAVRIWDRAPYSAFTDLTEYGGRLLCAFREGGGHHVDQGVGTIRVLESAEGWKWTPFTELALAGEDLRDPKFSITPGGELMMTVGAVKLHADGTRTVRTLAYFSRDGKAWGDPVVIGDEGMWLWRVTWHGGKAYAVGYGKGKLRLYASDDGRRFRAIVYDFAAYEGGNEASLVFDPDGTAYCFLRRDTDTLGARWGVSRPPYIDWEWKDLGRRVGSPQVMRAPDGRLIGVVRYFEGNVRHVAVVELDRAGGMKELAALPSSNGDSGYAGTVWRDGAMWVSYYSTHEARKTSIFIAKWVP
jgi:hypothetical protein